MVGLLDRSGTLAEIALNGLRIVAETRALPAATSKKRYTVARMALLTGAAADAIFLAYMLNI